MKKEEVCFLLAEGGWGQGPPIRDGFVHGAMLLLYLLEQKLYGEWGTTWKIDGEVGLVLRL